MGPVPNLMRPTWGLRRQDSVYQSDLGIWKTEWEMRRKSRADY